MSKDHIFVIIDEIRLSCKNWKVHLTPNGIHELVLEGIVFKEKKDVATFVKEMMKYIE